MILVTGAAGKTGRAIIQALGAQAEPIRGLVRRPEQTAVLEALGTYDIVVGDLGTPATVRRAMQGIRAVYHIGPNMHPDEEALGHVMLEAAQAAGVEHVVYHSVLHPQTEAMPHHWQKLRVEDAVLASGLPFTILQPAAYMQNVLPYWKALVAHGVYRIPYSATARLSLVDLHDVAEAAVLALTQPGHTGATYELSGPEPLSQYEIAALLAHHLKRPIQVETLPLDTWKTQAQANGLAPYAVETLAKMFAYYDRHGFVGNPNVLGWLLGRAPISFSTFVARTTQERDNEER